MIKATCPKNPKHKKFLVTAHVTQGWEVDEDGDFIKCTEECGEVTHTPDEDDFWCCSICGEAADVVDVDVDVDVDE